MYMISYDLREQRNYQPLYDILIKWKAVRALESLWLAELKGNAAAIRDILMGAADADDGILVLELTPGFDWAAKNVLPAGGQWLQAKSP